MLPILTILLRAAVATAQQTPAPLPAGLSTTLILPKPTGPIPLYSAGTPTSAQREMWRYQNNLYIQVRDHWKVPRAANDPWVKGATVQIRFQMQQDGSLLDPVVMMGSGRKAYDKSALESLVKAAPFAPLPDYVPAPVKFCVLFHYNDPERKKPSDPFAPKP
jgi:TonB family protein